METIRDYLNKAWNTKSVKTDWVRFEACLRKILLDGWRAQVCAETQLNQINEAIGAFTKRGEPYEDLRD